MFSSLRQKRQNQNWKINFEPGTNITKDAIDIRYTRVEPFGMVQKVHNGNGGIPENFNFFSKECKMKFSFLNIF